MITRCPHCHSQSGYYYHVAERRQEMISFKNPDIKLFRAESRYMSKRKRCLSCNRDITSYIEDNRAA